MTRVIWIGLVKTVELFLKNRCRIGVGGNLKES